MLRFWKPIGIVLVALAGSWMSERYGVGAILLPLVVVQGLAVAVALLIHETSRAGFNRLDDEPGATRRHSKAPPVSPLRKGGKKTRRRQFFSPLRRGGESRDICNASEDRSMRNNAVDDERVEHEDAVLSPNFAGQTAGGWFSHDAGLWAFVAAMVLYHAANVPGGVC